jgi:hypothetical protein
MRVFTCLVLCCPGRAGYVTCGQSHKTTYQVNGKYKTAKVLFLQGVEDAVLLP